MTRVALPWLLVWTLSLLSPAQSASLQGRVVDAAVSPLPGVKVTAMAAATGQAWQTVTDTAGAYRFDNLPRDTYRIDFDLQGFDLLRLTQVLGAQRDAVQRVDATLHVGAICECIQVMWPALQERQGQVVDRQGRPIAFARLEVSSPQRTESAHADHEGRFRVRLPLDTRWRLTASSPWHAAATQQVAGGGGVILFRLKGSGTNVKEDSQRVARGCRCGTDLFTHNGR